MGDAGQDRLARIAAAQRLAADTDAPRPEVAHPRERLGQLALAVARDAGDADDLALADRERNVVRRAVSRDRPTTVEPIDFEGPDVRRAASACSSGRTTSISRPTMRAASELQRGRRGVDSRDRPAAAQHRYAVGDGLDLVELVRDEDDGLALLGHRAERLEERFGLLRSEHGGRLVHDQDARLAVERLQDLDALLLADRELPDRAFGLTARP